jgi:uridylate kinase
MIATIVNALVLEDALSQADIPCRVYSALPVLLVAAPFDPERCLADLSGGRIVILAGGTGNPLFTTDTAAAVWGVELVVEIMLKATRVNGVYDADPEKHVGARLLDKLTYGDVLNRALGVMDLCAVSLCMEHHLPVRVFNYQVEGNMRRALAGEPIGTFIGE